jgi:hypothetical protein
VPCRQSREKRFKATLAPLETGESEALIFTKVDPQSLHRGLRPTAASV